MWGQLPRVEALHASTLGYEIATPTELPRQRGPSPTSLKPHPNPPQREGVPPNRLKHSRNELPPLVQAPPQPSQGEGVPSNRLKHSKNGLPPLGEGRGGALGGLGWALGGLGRGPSKQLFLYRRQPDFFYRQRRLFYRGHCWRHAPHDGGDGADAQEENLFSDKHWRHPHQGEAASSAHGFLCLFQPRVG